MNYLLKSYIQKILPAEHGIGSSHASIVIATYVDYVTAVMVEAADDVVIIEAGDGCCVKRLAAKRHDVE
jgi:hypothetical protein